MHLVLCYLSLCSCSFFYPLLCCSFVHNKHFSFVFLHCVFRLLTSEARQFPTRHEMTKFDGKFLETELASPLRLVCKVCEAFFFKRNMLGKSNSLPEDIHLKVRSIHLH